MRLGKRSCDKGLPSYGHLCAQVQSKTWKRMEMEGFNFSSIREEGRESPRTLQ